MVGDNTSLKSYSQVGPNRRVNGAHEGTRCYVPAVPRVEALKPTGRDIDNYLNGSDCSGRPVGWNRWRQALASQTKYICKRAEQTAKESLNCRKYQQIDTEKDYQPLIIYE
jgi:hypothetical protein